MNGSRLKQFLTHRKIVLLTATLLVVAGVATLAITITVKHSNDICIAPNDARVSCDELRENPSKTDWWDGE